MHRRGRGAAGAPLALTIAATLLGGCGGGEAVPESAARCRATEGTSSVEWVRAPGSRPERLAPWCAGVGPAVLAPQAAPPSRSAPDSLVVVAWNAALGAGDLGGLVGDLRAGRHTGGVPQEHFILLLQEVVRSDALVPPVVELPEGAAAGRLRRPMPVGSEPRDIRALARALGLALAYVPSMRNGFEDPPLAPEDRGNAILSTLPLGAVTAIELPVGLQRRVTVMAAVQGVGSDGATLRVASTHLDNFGSRDLLGSFAAVRARQAAALVRALPGPGAVVLGGDLNTWFAEAEEPAYRLVRSSFPWPREPQEMATATRLGRGRVLDYLFLRGPPGWRLRVRRVESRYGSDHHPVLGWVLPPAAAAEPR